MAAEEMVGKLATAEYKKRLCNSSSKKYKAVVLGPVYKRLEKVVL
jgi:hypothetical protein